MHRFTCVNREFFIFKFVDVILNDTSEIRMFEDMEARTPFKHSRINDESITGKVYGKGKVKNFPENDATKK